MSHSSPSVDIHAHARYSKIVLAAGVSVIPIFSALLSTLVLWRGLSAEPPDELGLFVLCNQAAQYLMYLQAGLDVAAMLAMSGFLATGRIPEAAHEYRTLQRTNGRIAYAVAICSVLGALLLVAVPVLDPKRNGIVTILVLLLGATQAATYKARPNIAAIGASNRLVLLSWVTAGQSALRFALGYTAFHFGAGVFSLAIGELAAQLLTTAALGRIARRNCPWVESEPEHEPRGHAARSSKDRLRDGGLISIGTIGLAVEAGCDIFILQLLPNGLATAAAYALWSRFPILAQSFTGAFVNNTLPPLKSSWGSDRSRAASLLKRLMLTQVGLCLVVAVLVGTWLPTVERFWLGAEFEKYEIPDSGRLASAFAASLAARSITVLAYNASVAFDSLALGSISIWGCIVVKVTLGTIAAVSGGMTPLVMMGLFAWGVPYAIMGIRLVYIRGASAGLLILGPLAVMVSFLLSQAFQPYAVADDLPQLIVRLAATGVPAVGVLFGWLILTGTIPAHRIRNILRRGGAGKQLGQ